MKEIPLTKGKVALVDDADFPKVALHMWQAICEGGRWYALTKTGGRKNPKAHRMHRVIMDAGPGQAIDHANGDGLDNRRSNLRLATASQNAQNKKKPAGGTSVYKGVRFRRDANRWIARIQHGGKRMEIGRFKTELEAARAYDTKARELFGEFARPNFPCP